METANRRLMWHGMFLFLLGLITGFLEQHFTNVRMGLAAHLEGVMRYFSARFGLYLAPGTATASGKARRILDSSLWHVRELALYDARSSLRHRGVISHHGCGAHGKTVAGKSGDGRLFECRPCDHCLLSASALGPAS